MLKILGIFLGLGLMTLGVMGFLPEFTSYGKLFNTFQVNSWHNLIHIVTGVLALICALSSGIATKIFFIIFGLIYAIFAGYGFMQGDGMLLNTIAVNGADNFLHAGIALAFLYFGLFLKSK